MGNKNHHPEPIQLDSDYHSHPRQDPLDIPLQEFHKTPTKLLLDNIEIKSVLTSKRNSFKILTVHKFTQKIFILYLYELEKDLEVQDPQITSLHDVLQQFSKIEHPHIQSIVDYHLIGEDKCFARYWRYIILMESYTCSMKEFFDQIIVKPSNKISERELSYSVTETPKESQYETFKEEESLTVTPSSNVEYNIQEDDILFICSSICNVLEYGYENNVMFVINDENVLLDFINKKVLYSPLTFDENTEDITPNLYSDQVEDDEDSPEGPVSKNNKFSEDKDNCQLHFKKQLSNLCYLVLKLALKEDFEFHKDKDVFNKKLDLVKLKYPLLSTIMDQIVDQMWYYHTSFKSLLEIIRKNLKPIESQKLFNFSYKQPEKISKKPEKLLKRFGKVYQSLKNYKQALDCFEQYLKSFKDINALKYREQLNYAYCLQKIAENHAVLGDYATATQEFKICLNYRLKNFPDKQLEIAKIHLFLSIALYNSGLMKEAIESCLTSLEYFKMHFGAKTVRYYKICLKVHLFLIKLKQNLFGKTHHSYLHSLATVAENYRKLEEYETGLPYAIENVDTLSKISEKNDPLLAAALNNLSIIYYKLGDYKNAQKYLKLTLERKKAIYGEMSASYAKTLMFLGKTYRELAEYKQAMKAFKKVLEIQQTLHDGTGEKVIEAMMHIAEVSNLMGKWNKSIDRYLKAGEIFKKMANDPNFDKMWYVELLIKVAKINEEHGEYDEALIFYQECLKFMQKRRIENAKLWDEVNERLDNLKVFQDK